jgi:hypothetical protein
VRDVEHHAGLKNSVECGRDGHCVAREAMQEVRGAIKWVDDPDQPVCYYERA